MMVSAGLDMFDLRVSSSLSFVLALDDLLVRKEMIHRQCGLSGILYIRLIMPRSVRPPFKLSVIKEDLARVKHLLAFRNRRMPITRMQEHFAFPRAHKIVLLIRNVDAVTIYPMQPVLIRKVV